MYVLTSTSFETQSYLVNNQLSDFHMAECHYVGVDVGTASVRAALVTREGLLKNTAEETISIWEPQSDHYVQSSTEIWDKCCMVVKVRSSKTSHKSSF